MVNQMKRIGRRAEGQKGGKAERQKGGKAEGQKGGKEIGRGHRDCQETDLASFE